MPVIELGDMVQLNVNPLAEAVNRIPFPEHLIGKRLRVAGIDTPQNTPTKPHNTLLTLVVGKEWRYGFIVPLTSVSRIDTMLDCPCCEGDGFLGWEYSAHGVVSCDYCMGAKMVTPSQEWNYQKGNEWHSSLRV